MENTTDDPTPDPQREGRGTDDTDPSDDQSPENLVTHGRTGDVLHRPPTPDSDEDEDQGQDADEDDEDEDDDEDASG